MGKNKKRAQETPAPAPPQGRVTPWNALFKLPEKERYRLYGFLVWLLGIFIILWVFKA